MLKFDPEAYLAVQRGAVALAPALRDTARSWFDAGGRNLFFMGAGGVNFLMLPAARLLQTRSSLPVHIEMSAEIVHSGSAHLGPQSLAVFPSVSGTTHEALAAIRFAQSRGATVLGLTADPATPIAELADISFSNRCADPTSSENFGLQSLLLALGIMDARGEIDDYEAVVAELAFLPELLVDAKRAFEPRAEALAAEIADEQHHIITGAGGSWYEAMYYGMCILEEMQWIWTRPVHASDFFHGTLELLEADTSVFILAGEDEQRPLTDRVTRFARTVTRKLRIIDTRDFALSGLSDRVRALVSPIVLAAVLERLSTHLERVRDHDLTIRRYYKKGDF
ncbi:SIS domain-containing protein [Leucobacter chromiiresistens]|uniref:Sugar isomerase n=1 Tax=Leucobacter chromiiresistens TaxID=1079994 RepID=A0A147EMJ3_9MICO|nr:SIS domain-containing protein [Leucobacter chromiiresistens]KTR85532.1 sugar isomerase [Leucobacter chromiiresistens]